MENNNLKEELERKSDLINIMLNAFNSNKAIDTKNVKLDHEEINEVQVQSSHVILFYLFY